MNTIGRILMLVCLFVALGQRVTAEKLTQVGNDRFAGSMIELTAPAIADSTVEIQSALGLSGRIEIIAEDVDMAGFEYRKLIKVGGMAEAKRYSGLIDVVLENRAGILRLLLKSPNPVPWEGSDNSVAIEGKLVLPEDCHLSIKCKYFDFSIYGPLSEVTNEPSFGKYQISDISNGIDITSIGNNLAFRNINGEIKIKAENANINVYEMNSDGTARIQSNSGNIVIRNYSGGGYIKNSYGKIKIDDAILDNCRLQISGEYCPVSLSIEKFSEAGLSVYNNNDDVDVSMPDGCSVQFDLQVDAESEIHIENMPLRPIIVQPKYINAVTGDGSGNVKVEIKNIGDIRITGDK